MVRPSPDRDKWTRKRPVVQLTLSVDARKRLDEMATRCSEKRWQHAVAKPAAAWSKG